MEFEYDVKKNFPYQPKWNIYVNYLLGLSLLLYGCTIFFLDNESGSSLRSAFGVFIILGGILNILMGLRKNKPIVKEGSQYLKIEDGKILWKLSPVHNNKTVLFREIKNIKFLQEEIYIETTDRTEHCIPIKKVVNDEKRNEFIGLLQKWYSNNSYTFQKNKP
jgi:hypothetical protein